MLEEDFDILMWPSPITAKNYHGDPPNRPENIHVTLPFEAPAPQVSTNAPLRHYANL